MLPYARLGRRTMKFVHTFEQIGEKSMRTTNVRACNLFGNLRPSEV